MHERRTSKLARETRKTGHIRQKRTSVAEEETAKEKASMAKPAADEEHAAHEHREGIRHTRPRTPAEKAEERPRHRRARTAGKRSDD